MSSFDVRPLRAIDLWLISVDLPSWQLGWLRETLSADERERASSYHFQRDANRFIAARAALRAILAGYLDCRASEVRFEYHCVCARPGCSPIRRKPTLAAECGGGSLQFNLSHSRAKALVAVTSGRRVGVDVEYVQPDVAWRPIATDWLDTAELATLLAVPEDQQAKAFFARWTRKEAHLKALGVGLPGAPHSHTGIAGSIGLPVDRRVGECDWTIRDLDVGPGYVASVAFEGPDAHIAYRQWPTPEHDFEVQPAVDPLVVTPPSAANGAPPTPPEGPRS